jgi:EAL domain-containing protein (putative c-di-GMP-specific phosphodiesterase class I)
MGVQLSIDDFGIGYSSLSYLKRFPIDSIKIDRSFVKDLPHNTDDAAIARAIIAMAQSLRLKTVAEGVENEAQLTFLAQHGCDEIQGFFFSEPLEESALLKYLETGNGK